MTFTAGESTAAPTGLQVDAAHQTLFLGWTEPSSGTVTGYDVQYTSATVASVPNDRNAQSGTAAQGWVAVTRSGTTASQTISGLTNASAYRVRVRATISTGQSAWVYGSGTPSAASVSLSGPATVVEGRSAVVTVTASPAVSTAADLEDRGVVLLSALGTAESSDIDDRVGNVELFMAQGVATATFEFDTSHDADQDDETFTVSIATAPTGYSVGSASSVTITIVDDDKPSVSLSVSPNPVQEGDPVTVTAVLSHATVKALTIPVRLTAGTAESGDYGALSEIRVAAGATSGSATVTTTKDVDDDEETFTVSLGEALPATVTGGSPASVVVTISEAVTVSLGPAEVFVAESEIPEGLVVRNGERVDSSGVRVVFEQARLNLVLSAAPSDAQSLEFAVITKRVTSEQGDHDEPQTVRYSSQYGRNSPVFIDVYGDYDDADEVFTVELDASKLPEGYKVGAQSKVTVTILEPPEVSLSVSEQRVLAGHPVTVTATLARPAPADTQIWIQVKSGSAGSGDYTAFWYNREGILAVDVAAGSTSGTTQVRTNGKDRDVCDETFTVNVYERPRYRLGNPSTVEVAIAGTNASAEQCQPDDPEPEPEEETTTTTTITTTTRTSQPVFTPQPTVTPQPTAADPDTDNNNNDDPTGNEDTDSSEGDGSDPDPDPDPDPDAGDGEVSRQVCQPPGRSAGFTDVEPGATHSACIEAIYAAGITKGCNTNPLRYCGDDPVTRAEMASFLARALKLRAPARSAGFTDVDPAGTHSTDIEAIYAAGITNGCNTNPLRYCGDDPVTRAEMASFLARALKLRAPARSAGFTDVDPAGTHSTDIEAIYAAGITNGCRENPLRYCGNDPVTRAEMASFLARALKL